ncbi:MAG: hypothetical protein HC846_02060 [Blastocatellia bacterium]|nr:hypothetical protein [Blastocatellia bacterium]
MKNALNLISVITLFFLIGCGCLKSSKTSPPTSQISNEILAREQFAQKEEDNCSFAHVSIYASGDNKDILEIRVVDDVSPNRVSGVIDLIVSEQMRREAKKLKFTAIIIKGGSRSLIKEDSINVTIPLVN